LRTVLFLCTGNYFRSRFAELLFNDLAARAALPVRARSAGLAAQCHTRNLGPISRHTLAALRARGVAAEDPPRLPRDVTEEDLAGAELVIALKEREHRPMLAERFPGWPDRIRYWDVDDIPRVPAAEALGRIEELVRALVAELLACPPPANTQD
jgi:protein-tyrosine phosphatase